MRRSLKGSGKNAITRVLIALLLILAGALLMMPFYFMFLSSLKPGTEILRLGLSFQFDPGVSSFTNYAALNTYRDGIYWKWYQSSLVIMVLQTSVGLFFSSIVGYALAMYHFKGPVSTEKNGWPASKPLNRRIVVPELPASSTLSGSLSPYKPLPRTATSPFDRTLTDTPSARMQATVDRQSAEARKFLTVTGVSAKPASIMLRCDSDLSPGTATVPRKARAGVMTLPPVMTVTLLPCYMIYYDFLPANSCKRIISADASGRTSPAFRPPSVKNP